MQRGVDAQRCGCCLSDAKKGGEKKRAQEAAQDDSNTDTSERKIRNDDGNNDPWGPPATGVDFRDTKAAGAKAQ